MANTVSRTGASPWAMRSSAKSGAVWVMAPPAGRSAGGGPPRQRAAGRPHPLRTTPGSARGAAVERRVQGDRRVDEGQVGERLREVADLLPGQGDLLGEQAHVVGVG